MKNLIFGIILILMLFQSCKEDEIPTCENCNFTCLDTNETDVITNDCIDNWTCSFKVWPASKVDIEETQGISSGDKIVFQMLNDTQGSLQVADDELARHLVFEVAESQNSFSVENNELALMQVHFMQACYCLEVEFKAATSGCLQGEKQEDGTWFIQGNLSVPFSSGNVEVKVDAQFAE